MDSNVGDTERPASICWKYGLGPRPTCHTAYLPNKGALNLYSSADISTTEPVSITLDLAYPRHPYGHATSEQTCSSSEIIFWRFICLD